MSHSIIYIQSFPRSGSTVFANVLSSAINAPHIGEIDKLWIKKLDDHHKCGCGDSILECKHWNALLKRITNSNGKPLKDLVNARYYEELHTSRVKFESNTISYKYISNKESDRIKEVYVELFRSLEADRIIDSSKSFSLYNFLREESFVEIKGILIIRDIRGVLNSRLHKTFSRNKYNLNPISTFIHAIKDIIDWNIFYLKAYKRRNEYLIVKYEEFSKRPNYVLEKISHYLGMNYRINETNSFTLPANHTFWGNRNRIGATAISIKEDFKWKSKLPLLYKITAIIISFPVMMLYAKLQDDGRI